VIEAGLLPDADGNLDYEAAAEMMLEEDLLQPDSDDAHATAEDELAAIPAVTAAADRKAKPLRNASARLLKVAASRPAAVDPPDDEDAVDLDELDADPAAPAPAPAPFPAPEAALAPAGDARRSRRATKCSKQSAALNRLRDYSDDYVY
jgi:hypothetical protein